MNEFESGVKRKKIDETHEKTMYDDRNQTEKAKDDSFKKPIGGDIKKKRDMKNDIKSKHYKYKDLNEEDSKITEKLAELKRYYNQLRVKKGELKPNREQKNEIIENCLNVIANDYKDIIFKHDGCRVLQCMIKHSNVEHKKKIIESLIEHFPELMIQKYSYHLAYKMVEYCPTDEIRAKILSTIINKISKFIMHSYASEVIEQLYIT